MEPDTRIENAELTDSENVCIAKDATISKSTVGSPNSLFRELPELPKLRLQTSRLHRKRILKCFRSIWQIRSTLPTGR